MKNKFWLGLAFAVALNASLGLVIFAEDVKTNCIGDKTGKTNCVSPVVEEELIGAANLAVDTDEISFGRITKLGRRYSKVITISNNSDKTATARVEVVAYEDGIDQSLSASDWVAFAGGKRKFEIKPKNKLQLGVRLMVPSEVTGGTYYAKIKISSGDEDLDKYITVRADVVTDEYKYGGEITGQSIGFVNLGDKVSANVSLRNSGTAGFKAKYTVNYKSAFGLPEWKSLKEEYVDVLPGKEAEFSIEDKEAIGYGLFTVEQKISYIDAKGQAKEAVLSHVVVNLPWWSLVIVGGVIILIIAIAVVIKKHRRKVEEAEREKKARKSKKKVTIEVMEGE